MINDCIGRLQLQKMFMEARHNGNFIFADIAPNLADLIRKNMKDFPQNNMNLTNNSLTMIDPNKRQSTTIDSNRIIIDIDQPAGVDTFYSIACNAVKNTISTLKIDNLSRIGVRAFWGIEVKDFAETNKRIFKKIVKLDNSEFKIFGEDFENFHFGFNTSFEKYKINYNFTPGAVHNINIGPQGSNTVVLNYLMADIDFFIETVVESDEISTFIRKACDESQKRAKDYFGLIGGKINGD